MSGWITKWFCASCHGELTYSQVMGSLGRCPLCGVRHEDACTIVNAYQKAARWVRTGWFSGHWEIKEDEARK